MIKKSFNKAPAKSAKPKSTEISSLFQQLSKQQEVSKPLPRQLCYPKDITHLEFKEITIPALDNSKWRLLDDWRECKAIQTYPEPTLPPGFNLPPVQLLSVNGPEPIIKRYDNPDLIESTTPYRRMFWTQEDIKETDDRIANETIQNRLQTLRRGAEVHRQARRNLQSKLQVGMTLREIVDIIENKVLELTNADGLKSGWGFPTGVSLNGCAAHYTPNKDCKMVFTEKDIMKVDFGVHFEGNIVDSAFSVAVDPKFDPLIAASQDATNVGVAMAGDGVRVKEMASAMKEAMESYCMEDGADIKPVKALLNLCGHEIKPYIIHAGVSISIDPRGISENLKLQAGHCYAIETFASTGSSYVVNGMPCSHYMANPRYFDSALRNATGNTLVLLNAIKENFDTLPWCLRWIDEHVPHQYLMDLRKLVREDVITDYPPLVINNGHTSQMEHTVFVRSNCTEVISRGDDY